MSSNDGARRNDAALSDPYAGENNAPQADPHTVVNHDWPDVVRIRCAACPSELGVTGMAIGIHQNDAAGEIAISANGDFFTDSELTVMPDLRPVANLEERPIRKPRRKSDSDLAIEPDIVAKNDVSRALYIMDVTIGAQIPPVFFAIGLKQWLADEHT